MEKEPQLNNYDEYEIDLREYIMILWKNKFFIGGLVILAMIITFLVSSFVLKPQYESEAKILAPEFRLINGNDLSKEEYISFLTGDTVIEDILKVVNHDRSEGEKVTSQSLLNRLSYDLSENTNQIEFSFN
ncbi:MAG: Wzz/FepE/Etk N-terminal domain-containing protein, partial [Halanaerobium sp.]